MDFDDFVDLMKTTFFAGISIALPAFIILVLPINIYQKYQCNSYEKISGIETQYNNFDDCYIHTKNGWMLWDEYLKRNIGIDSIKELKTP